MGTQENEDERMLMCPSWAGLVLLLPVFLQNNVQWEANDELLHLGSNASFQRGKNKDPPTLSCVSLTSSPGAAVEKSESGQNHPADDQLRATIGSLISQFALQRKLMFSNVTQRHESTCLLCKSHVLFCVLWSQKWKISIFITVIIVSLHNGASVPVLYDSLYMSNRGCTSFSLNLS